jgi:hypothetical protein
MNNPKTRDDDERSSIANQKEKNQSATDTEARRVVEGGEADQQSQKIPATTAHRIRPSGR